MKDIDSFFEYHKNGERYFILSSRADYGDTSKKTRVFAFEEGALFPEMKIDKIIEKYHVVIYDGKEDYERRLWIEDKTSGVCSEWNLVGSFPTEFTEEEIAKIIDNYNREYPKVPTTKTTKNLIKLIRSANIGSYGYRNYRDFSRHETDIILSPHKDTYDVNQLNKFYEIELKKSLEDALGIVLKSVKIPEVNENYMWLGKLAYEESIGSLDTIEILEITDEELKSMEGLDANNRISKISHDKVKNKVTITLYPDKFMVLDRMRGKPIYNRINLDEVKMYQKHKKCHNWWPE